MNTNSTNAIIIKILKNTAFKNISSNSIDIIFNFKGTNKLTLNSTMYSLGLYDVVVANPFEPYIIYEGKGDSTVILLRINRSLLNLSEEILSMRFNCNSCDINKARFQELYKLIYDYIKDYESKTYLQSAASAYSFIDELIKSFLKKKEDKKKTDFDSILNYIEINYDQDLLLNDIADEFNLTVPYLSKKFKEIIGKTFNDYYDELRIMHSNYDLYETDLPIIEIALKHGFPSAQAYLRSFKKINGILPSDARKNKKVDIIDNSEAQRNIFDSIIKELSTTALTTKAYREININANYNQALLMKIKNKATNTLGVGSARLLLYRNIQDILIKLQKEYHFNHVHIKGLFSDDFSFVSRKKTGELSYSFSLIDSILDFLDSINLYPVINFVYMPAALASKDKTVFSKNFNVSLPKSMDEWQEFLHVIIDHFIERYGIEKIKEWIFIPWDKPDTGSKQIGFDDFDEFFGYYEITYKTIKKINSSINVSSPIFIPLTDKNLKYFNNFLDASIKNNCVPSLLSLAYFSNSNLEELFDFDLQANYRMMPNQYKMANDAKHMNRFLKNIESILEHKNIKMPIHLMEFNYTITHKHPLLDTIFNANYILKNYLDNMDLISSYAYWSLTDYENSSIQDGLFFGGSGQFCYNNLAKPAMSIYHFLRKIDDEIISKGNNYVISRDSKNPNHLIIIIYNYEHPTNNEFLTIDEEDRYNLFLNKERHRVSLTIAGIPYNKAFIREFSLNIYHGSPYDRWVLMGKPKNDVYHHGFDPVNLILTSSTNPDYKEVNLSIDNKTLKYELNVDSLEIKALEIELK